MSIHMLLKTRVLPWTIKQWLPCVKSCVLPIVKRFGFVLVWIAVQSNLCVYSIIPQIISSFHAVGNFIFDLDFSYSFFSSSLVSYSSAITMKFFFLSAAYWLYLITVIWYIAQMCSPIAAWHARIYLVIFSSVQRKLRAICVLDMAPIERNEWVSLGNSCKSHCPWLSYIFIGKQKEKTHFNRCSSGIKPEKVVLYCMSLIKASNETSLISRK